MARLVYIKEVDAHTLLHWSPSEKGGYVLLRDFSKSGTAPPIEYKRDKAEAEGLLAKQPPNFNLNSQPHGQKDPGIEGANAIKIWHDYVCVKNKEYNLLPSPSQQPQAEQLSLLDRIKKHPIIVAMSLIISAVILVGSLTGALTNIIKFFREGVGGQ